MAEPKKFKILCIDGGGIKGLYSAQLLAKFEDVFNVRISDCFDMLCGTSTGGIIALAASLKKPMRDVVTFYEQDGPIIFNEKLKKRPHGNKILIAKQVAFGGKYSVEPLRQALKNVFGTQKIGESNNFLCIPSYNVNTAIPRIFKKDYANFTEDDRKSYVDVALATAAAPTYFPMMEIMRTAGMEMPEQKFVIAGLGSIGSNLVYFLNGWNNASFTLIDNDRFRTENIGRHLLGFHDVSQNKVEAVANYLRSIRPEREVETYSDDFQNVFENCNEKLNTCSALFLCTGDAMTEKFVIDAFHSDNMKQPTFILWLEPFGIAGHLVYINPMQMPKNFVLYKDKGSMLYKYNLLAPIEYEINADRFTKKDAGCNGEYALYSGNDVTLMLSAFYPYINKLIQQPEQSKCYRWVGNIKLAQEKGFKLTIEVSSTTIGHVEELPL